MKNCTAVTWTMETNFAPKEYIKLCDWYIMIINIKKLEI
jgi:hypothetical protein